MSLLAMAWYQSIPLCLTHRFASRLAPTGEMLRRMSKAMRQLVTRQKTTRFIPGNGTTLSTLIDPDQNPQGIDPAATRPDSLRCEAFNKKNEFEFAALHTRGGRWVQASSQQPYYLTEEDLCSV
jgi:hypothetical protein